MSTVFQWAMSPGYTGKPPIWTSSTGLKRDQWLRASQSIPLNIAEGTGKTAGADRRRSYEIARDSVLECAAIQDVLVVGKALAGTESRERKDELDRMAAMLSRLGGRSCFVKKEPAVMDGKKSISIVISISISKRTKCQRPEAPGRSLFAPMILVFMICKSYLVKISYLMIINIMARDL